MDPRTGLVPNDRKYSIMRRVGLRVQGSRGEPRKDGRRCRRTTALPLFVVRSTELRHGPSESTRREPPESFRLVMKTHCTSPSNHDQMLLWKTFTFHNYVTTGDVHRRDVLVYSIALGRIPDSVGDDRRDRFGWQPDRPGRCRDEKNRSASNHETRQCCHEPSRTNSTPPTSRKFQSRQQSVRLIVPRRPSSAPYGNGERRPSSS